MKVIALDTHDGYREGDEYEVADRHAEQLIRKGLVKAGPVPKNKMAPPTENKSDPSGAAGEIHTSSSLPVGRVFPTPIAVPLNAGDSAGLSREQVRAMMREADKTVAEITQPDNLPPEVPTPRKRGRPPKAKPAE